MQSEDASRQRVFVSSIIEGFETFREAARRGIEAAGCEPILVNEQTPSVPKSPRNACLDAVASCDIYVAIIGERGGWTAPSGKLVVEEEFEEARRRNLPVFVFIHNTERDAEAERLAHRLSDFVQGYFRVEVDDPDELEHEIQRALTDFTKDIPPSSMDLPAVQDRISEAQPVGQDPSLRVVLAPQRREEIISPLRLESAPFRSTIFQHAHQHEIALLQYERSKSYEIVGDTFVIRQERGGRHGADEHSVRLEINENGDVVIDVGLVPASEDAFILGGANMTIATADLEKALGRALSFCAAFYDEIDEHDRYQQFGYNVALVNLGMRKIAAEEDAGRSSSHYHQHNEPLPAYDAARPLTRNTLRSPEQEIRRAIVKIRRRSEQPPPNQGIHRF